MKLRPSACCAENAKKKRNLAYYSGEYSGVLFSSTGPLKWLIKRFKYKTPFSFHVVFALTWAGAEHFGSKSSFEPIFSPGDYYYSTPPNPLTPDNPYLLVWYGLRRLK